MTTFCRDAQSCILLQDGQSISIMPQYAQGSSFREVKGAAFEVTASVLDADLAEATVRGLQISANGP